MRKTHSFMLKFKQFLPVILLIILALIWGSSFILMKNALKVYSPAQLATARMFISFICLLPFTFYYITKVKRKYWAILVISGLTGSGIPAILFATAQTKINSSTAGVLNSLTPIFVLLIAVLVFRQKFSAQKVTGVILGLLGAVLLVILRSNGTIEINYFYGLLIVIATFCYGLNVNIVKNYLQDLPPMAISGLTLVLVGPVYGYYLFAHTDFTIKILESHENVIAFLNIFILSLFGTAISLVLFNKLIHMTNAIYASSVTYLMPIVALFWGVIDGEPLGIVHFIGMGAILSGVYLANRKTNIETQ